VAAGGLVILDLPELHEVEYKERIDLDWQYSSSRYKIIFKKLSEWSEPWKCHKWHCGRRNELHATNSATVQYHIFPTGSEKSLSTKYCSIIARKHFYNNISYSQLYSYSHGALGLEVWYIVRNCSEPPEVLNLDLSPRALPALCVTKYELCYCQTSVLGNTNTESAVTSVTVAYQQEPTRDTSSISARYGPSEPGSCTHTRFFLPKYLKVFDWGDISPTEPDC
jgi:hypothetical protein